MIHPVKFCRALSGVQDLAAAIKEHNRLVSTLDADLRCTRDAVEYLARAEKNARLSRGHKVEV
jgi:hypothetical protein